MRLPEPGWAVQEERVVGLAGRLGDRERGSVGEAVAGPDDESLEGVVGVERDLGGRLDRGGGGGGGGGPGEPPPFPGVLSRAGGPGAEEGPVTGGRPPPPPPWGRPDE